MKFWSFVITIWVLIQKCVIVSLGWVTEIFELQNFVLFRFVLGFSPLRLPSYLFIDAKHDNITKTKNTHGTTTDSLHISHSNFLPSYISSWVFLYFLLSDLFLWICKFCILIWRTSVSFSHLQVWLYLSKFGTNLIIKFRTINFAIPNFFFFNIPFLKV